MSDVTIRKYLIGKLDWEVLYKKAFLNHIRVQKLPFYKGLAWEKELDQETLDSTSVNVIDKNPIAVGQKLRLIYPAEDKSLTFMAEYIKSEWEPYINMEILGLNQAEYLTALQSSDFDVYLTKSKVPEYTNIRDFFGTGGRYNYSQITVLDHSVNAFLAAKTEEEQKQAYLSLAKEVDANLWIVPFGFLENAVILSSQVEGNLTSKTFDILFGITEIKVVE